MHGLYRRFSGHSFPDSRICHLVPHLGSQRKQLPLCDRDRGLHRSLVDRLSYLRVVDLRRVVVARLVSSCRWLSRRGSGLLCNRRVSSIRGCGVRVCVFRGKFYALALLDGGWRLFHRRGRLCVLPFWILAAASTSGVLTLSSAAASMRWLGCDHHFGAGRELSLQGIGPCWPYSRARTYARRWVADESLARSIVRKRCHSPGRRYFEEHLRGQLSGVLPVPLLNAVVQPSPCDAPRHHSS